MKYLINDINIGIEAQFLLSELSTLAKQLNLRVDFERISDDAVTADTNTQKETLVLLFAVVAILQDYEPKFRIPIIKEILKINDFITEVK